MVWQSNLQIFYKEEAFMEAFIQPIAEFFSFLSGLTFEIVYTTIVGWMSSVAGWDFQWGTPAA